MTQDGAGKLGEEALDEVEPGAVLGRERKVEAACRSCVEPGSGFPRDVCGMIVEDQLDRGAGRIGGIEKLEEFDELAAAVAISDERVDLAGEQINPGQQAERAMTFVLMIAREGRMNVRHGWQIRRRRSDDLDARLLVVGDDRCRLRRLLFRFGGGLFQDLDLAVDTQNLRHLLLELGVASFQVVAHLVRLDVLLAEDLAQRALDQMGETFVPCRRSALARMTGQKPRRPQLVRIAVLLGLIARQRYQPGFRFRRNRRLLARSRSVVEGCQRAIRQCPLDAALDRLMMYAKSLSHGKKRPLLAIGEQICARSTWRAASVLDRERAVSVSISSAVIAKSTARRHPAMMPLLVHLTANEESTNKSPVP